MSCRPFMCGSDPECLDKLCEGHPCNLDRDIGYEGGCNAPDTHSAPRCNWKAIGWFATLLAAVVWAVILGARHA
jgi:hypothetical protein